MKDNRWLIILVLILLIVNVSIFLLIRYGKVDQYVKNLVIQSLELVLDARVKIDHISLNDKQLFANNISIVDKKQSYNINAEQLRIDYNLLRLLFTRNQFITSSFGIRIYEPVFDINVDNIRDDDISFEMPDIYQYFKQFDLFNGKVNLNIALDEISFVKTIKNINIKAFNEDSVTKIRVDIKDSENLIMEADISKTINKVPIINAEISELNLDNISLFSAVSLSSQAQISINTDINMDYYISLNNIELKYEDITIVSDSLVINGNQDKFFIESDMIKTKNLDKYYLNDINTRLQGSMTYPLEPNKTEFILNLISENIRFSTDYIIPETRLIANVMIQGDYRTISTNSRVFSRAFMYMIPITDDLVIVDEIYDLDIAISNSDILNKPFDVRLIADSFLDSRLRGVGKADIFKENYTLSLYADEIQYTFESTADFFKFDLESSIVVSKNDKYRIQSTNLLKSILIDYKDNHFVGDEIDINTNNEHFALNYTMYDKKIKGKADLNILNKSMTSETTISRFYLNQINSDLPEFMVDSDIHLVNRADELGAKINLALGDDLIKSNYLNLVFDMVYKKSLDSLQCNIDVFDSFINYIPFFAQIEAFGTRSIIESDKVNINNMFDGAFYFEHGLFDEAKDESEPKISYSIGLDCQNVEIYDIAHYFFHRNFAMNFQGLIDINFMYNNMVPEQSPLLAEVTIKNLQYPPFNPIDVFISGEGDWDRFELEHIDILNDDTILINAIASIRDYGKSFDFICNFTSDLRSLQSDKDLTGKVFSAINMQLRDLDITAHAVLVTEDVRYKNNDLIYANIDITQFSDRLQVNHAHLRAGVDFRADITGALNYNFFLDTVSPIEDSLHIAIYGNPVRYFKDFTEIIVGGSSSFYADSYITMDEDGLVFNKGKIDIKDTWIRFLTQPENLENIQVYGEIVDNQLVFDVFQARMGRSYLYIRNEISPYDENFIFANLNIGKFFIRTDETGLLFHFPTYMPRGSVANTVIKGRNSSEATITGPFDDMKILADVDFFNGNAIYPENTDNILRMFDFLRGEMRSSPNGAGSSSGAGADDLPFELDLMLVFTRNCRYVTYPMNLLISPNSFLHIIHNESGLVAHEADFRSDEGSVELFGTVFRANHVEFRINPYDSVPTLYGSFTRKVADGTTITLEVFTDKSSELPIMESLRFNLKSDNSEDRTVPQILAKLRYGKSLEELSENQFQGIFQDEAIHLLGVSVGTALLDPYISPIENRLRRYFRLDNLSINPGFVQNLISENIWDDSNRNDFYASNFGSNILLNNLSVELGKYIQQNLYFEYNLLFQEGTDLEYDKNILMYQTYGLRYDLPYRFKVRYSYELNPKSEKNAHEIFLMRSFRF